MLLEMKFLTTGWFINDFLQLKNIYLIKQIIYVHCHVIIFDFFFLILKALIKYYI